MIVDARHLPEHHALTADVCIVGGGPAGISLAHALIDSGLSVILAEAGDREPDADLSPVFDGEVCDPVRHTPLSIYRSRCLGGTTSLWGGRCAPFDPIDFERRDWVPYSGWPISRADLDAAYRRAMVYCDAGPFTWRVSDALPGHPPEMIPGFDDDVVVTNTIDRFSPPTHFGRRFAPDLTRAANVQVLLNANCLRLGLSSLGNRVDVLHMASRPGRDFTIQARTTVLAAGGLETTRLLLLSDDVAPGGIGNRHDLVGRFYQCHLEGKAGHVTLRPGVTGVVHDYERDAEGVYCRRRLSISPDAQREHGLLNFVARLEHPPIPDPSHRSGVLSAMYLSLHFLKEEYARKIASFGNNAEAGPPSAKVLALHLRNVVVDFPALLRFSIGWFPKRKLVGRKIPYITLPNRNNRWMLDYYAEQVPNPDSRVSLIEARDPFGRRRLQVDWRATAQDHANVVATFKLLQERLAASGLGTLDFDESELIGRSNAVGGHHLGTTRMAESSLRGVVDADCRVFDVDNLFIAAPSAFPTGSYVNPTLTVVAMALRLANHLKVALRPPVAPTHTATASRDAHGHV